MHQLGYQADWQREEVQDGGAKQRHSLGLVGCCLDPLEANIEPMGFEDEFPIVDCQFVSSFFGANKSFDIPVICGYDQKSYKVCACPIIRGPSYLLLESKFWLQILDPSLNHSVAETIPEKITTSI
jgi:hypothetical protein